MTAATISERLADHVIGLRYDDISAAVLDKAKDLLVYALGTAFRGRGNDNGRRALSFAHEFSGAADACVVVGEARRAGLFDAVFANSALMQCSGLQDFSPPGVNAGVVIVPVA